jgi:Dynamin GTPase effector domain
MHQTSDLVNVVVKSEISTPLFTLNEVSYSNLRASFYKSLQNPSKSSKKFGYSESEELWMDIPADLASRVLACFKLRADAIAETVLKLVLLTLCHGFAEKSNHLILESILDKEQHDIDHLICEDEAITSSRKDCKEKIENYGHILREVRAFKQKFEK